MGSILRIAFSMAPGLRRSVWFSNKALCCDWMDTGDHWDWLPQAKDSRGGVCRTFPLGVSRKALKPTPFSGRCVCAALVLLAVLLW